MKIQKISNQQSFRAIGVEYSKIKPAKMQSFLELMNKAKAENTLDFGLLETGKDAVFFKNHKYKTKAEKEMAKEISEYADDIFTVPLRIINRSREQLKKSTKAFLYEQLKLSSDTQNPSLMKQYNCKDALIQLDSDFTGYFVKLYNIIVKNNWS